MSKLIDLTGLKKFLEKIRSENLFTKGTGDGSVIQKSYYNIASGDNSLASGYENESLGEYSTAIGNNNLAEGRASVALGSNTYAKGVYSFSEGFLNVSSGAYSHSEGYRTTASGGASHCGGGVYKDDFIYLTGLESVSGGKPKYKFTTNGNFIPKVGMVGSFHRGDPKLYNVSVDSVNAASNPKRITFSSDIGITDEMIQATEDKKIKIVLSYSNSSGFSSFSHGKHCVSEGDCSFATGDNTLSLGNSGFSSGKYTAAKGDYSIAGGNGSVAIGNGSMAIGSGVSYIYLDEKRNANNYVLKVTDNYIVPKVGDYIEGPNLIGDLIKIEEVTVDSGGKYIIKISNYANAPLRVAIPVYSLIAKSNNEIALGRFNKSSDSSENGTLLGLGNGTQANRKNAFEVMQNGDAYIYNLLGSGASGNYDGTNAGQNGIKTIQSVTQDLSSSVSGLSSSVSDLSSSVSNKVSKSGDETVGGKKTFSSEIGITESASMQYDSANKCIKFIFN